MATNQSAVKKQDDWQDYTPAAGGGDGWQDYAPAKPARAHGPVTPAEVQQISPKTQFEKDRTEGERGVGAAIKRSLPGLFADPKASSTELAGVSNLTDTGAHDDSPGLGERLKHGWEAGKLSPIGRAGTSLAYAAAPVAGINPKTIEEKAEHGDAGGIVGESSVPAAMAVSPMAAEGLSKITPGRSDIGLAMRTEKGSLKPAVREGARIAGVAAGHLTGIPGAEIAGALGGPAMADFLTPKRPFDIPTKGANPGASLPLAEDFYTNRGKDLLGRDRQTRIAERQSAKQADEAERLKPVYPGAQLPSAEDFYENKAQDLMRRGQAEERIAKRAVPEPPAAEGPGLPKAQVVKLPVPREPVPTDNPGYMHSIPRAKLLDLARQGRPGAGQQLQNIGKTPLYVPESYPGPRPEGLQRVEPRYAYRAHDIGAPEKMDLERSHAHATLDPEEALRYKQGRNGGVEQATSKNDLSRLKEGFDYDLVPGPNGKQWVKYRTPRAKSEFEPHE